MRIHQKLEVWHESIKLVKLIYEVTKSFPVEEKFGITSQIRRASVSIACNIAEGAARKSDKEYLRFAYISRGSLSEVETLLIISKELGTLRETEFESIEKVCNRESALLNGLIKKLMSSL